MKHLFKDYNNVEDPYADTVCGDSVETGTGLGIWHLSNFLQYFTESERCPACNNIVTIQSLGKSQL